ncbi:hypothetical protein ACVIHF_004544 [Bradyrhizobium sp. USDA 4506]
MTAPDIELRALLLPESEPLMARPEIHISACPDGPAHPRATPRPGRFFLIFSRDIAARWGARTRPVGLHRSHPISELMLPWSATGQPSAKQMTKEIGSPIAAAKPTGSKISLAPGQTASLRVSDRMPLASIGSAVARIIKNVHAASEPEASAFSAGTRLNCGHTNVANS